MSVRCALVQTRLCPCNPHFAASTPPFSLTRQRFASGVSVRTGRGLGRLVAYATEMQTEATVGELLIVGPGVLGSYLGKLWIDKGGSVTGRTNTTNNHPRLKALGIAPQTYEDCGEHKFPNVVFCAPPSGSEDYAGSVRDAVGYWDGSGTFVFTSSTGVYPRTGLVTEDSPTVEMGKSERNDHILQAENAVLEAGGNVVRLGGLFHSGRGPHTFIISSGTYKRPPNHAFHLIHYEDAALLVLQVLLHDDKFQSQIFLAAHPEPITVKELLDAALATGLYEGNVEYEQEADPSPPSRTMDNSKTVQMLDGKWSPQYTFASLMKSGANDWYRTSGLW